MISYNAFFEELEKIGEAQQPKRDINKEKLRRALIVAGATGAGLGLGHGAGLVIRRYGTKPAVDAAKKAPGVVRKYGPMVVGGLGAGTAALAATHRKKADRYIDEGERSKQHGPLGSKH